MSEDCGARPHVVVAISAENHATGGLEDVHELVRGPARVAGNGRSAHPCQGPTRPLPTAQAIPRGGQRVETFVMHIDLQRLCQAGAGCSHSGWCGARLGRPSAGSSKPASTAITAITTSNSTRLKPREICNQSGQDVRAPAPAQLLAAREQPRI